MLSRRVPGAAALNAWTLGLEARRQAGDALIDLTDANPARAGLPGVPLGAEGLAHDPALAAEPMDPRGMRAGREAVAAYYRDRGLDADPAHVVLTTGTSESYAHLFRLLADPGQPVAAPRPSYPLFEPLARAEGVPLLSYRLEETTRWSVDLDSVEAALEAGARAVLVVQPHHPAGICLTAEERAQLERLCAAHDAAVVSDEVFGDFGWDPSRRSLPSLLGESAAATFVLSGLSKVCGRPELKLGWIVASGPRETRERSLAGLEWLADLHLSVGSPVQRALPRLLASRHEFQRRVHERIDANLATLRARVARSPELRLPGGDGGWVAALRVPERDGEESLALALLGRGVVAHPGHFYDFDHGAWLVLSLIVPPDRLAAGLDRLDRVLSEG